MPFFRPHLVILQPLKTQLAFDPLTQLLVMVGELLGIPAATLSFHLKELAHADLVGSRQEGRFIIYTANFSAMNELLAFLTENCCGGNPCTPVCTPACSVIEED